MKKIFKIFTIIIITLFVLSPLTALKAENVSISTSSPPLLVDNADILSSEEETRISSELYRVSDKYNVDIVLLTVNSTENKSLQDYSDDYFDYEGYGRGTERSGILMLVDMYSRTIYFSTRGSCIYSFTDYGIAELENTVIDEIIDYGYTKAFIKYVNECDRYLNEAQQGKPIDVVNEPEPEFQPNAIVSVIIGGISSVVSSFVQKGKNKSVVAKTTASDYTRNGSFKVNNANQWFLYSNVSKTRIERNNNSSGGHSSGGSSTHVSSSGATHGGGGGNRHF